MHGSFCWFCCAAAHVCNIGKCFMHFKNLQVLYLYWRNICVNRKLFYADEHVIHVCFLLAGLRMIFRVYICVLAEFCIKIQHLFS